MRKINVQASPGRGEKRRPFRSVGGKERKKTRAAGAGGRPERDGEGLRRIRRISSTFDHTLGHARGAEYEFITQDHKTSIQMKLARRACLERDISRCAHFICLDMSSAHRKTRAAPGSAGKRFLNAAAPRARGRARGHTGQHNYNESRSRSCCSHTQCGRAAGKAGEANRALINATARAQ